MTYKSINPDKRLESKRGVKGLQAPELISIALIDEVIIEAFALCARPRSIEN